jgi:hypothetical protein
VSPPAVWSCVMTKSPDAPLYLVSCVSKKRDTPTTARALYVSDWFIKARTYVEATCSPWFILSAEYGLLHPDAVVAPRGPSTE